mgnify:FL=1
MSSNTRDRRRIVSSLLLAMMFLFADLALPQAVPDWSNEVLEDEKTVFQTLSTFNSSKDTAIESSNPMTNFGSDESVKLGSSFAGESKILISFNNTVPGTDLVTDAILKLTCGVDPLDIGVINIYNSRLLKSWDEDNATWSDADNGVSWQLPGAEGSADYESWEPPFYGYANNTFSINVTAVVQDAVANSRSSIDLVLAATGTQYDCQMSETQNFGEWPYLQITHQTGTHSNGGSLSPNFVEDGAALMDDSQFVLSAATNPELSWEGLTGNHAQVQLSMSNNFFSNDDENWFYNTKDNSSIFTLNSGDGMMTIPAGDELSNSSTMHYRMRSIDSTETIGSWQTGYFHLPGHSITMDGNYGTLSIGFDDLGLTENTIEDTFIDFNNKNANLGSEENFTVGSSSSSDQYGLMRLNLDDLGLHHNSSIISANIIMTRDSFSGTADVSMHIMDGEEWTEDGVTWRKYDGTNYWDDGGRVPSMSVGNFTGSQSSSTIEVDIAVALQHWIDENNDAIQAGLSPESSLELLMVASTFGIEESSTQSVKICATESASCNQPKIEITYDWDSNGPPGIPEHVAPLDGHGVWDLVGDNLTGDTNPTLSWNGSMVWSGDMIMQVAKDPEYREIIHSFNTADSSTSFAPSDGNWTVSSTDTLQDGVMYHWRLAQQDSTTNHHSWWETSSFLVSGLESEYIQDDEHRLRLSHGNATTAGDSPDCGDTYIDSGTPTSNYNGEDDMQVSYNTFPSETSILLGCDLTSHLLPSGYAVQTATLKMRLSDYPIGSPKIGAWESRQHNWTEEGATWQSYDGNSANSWGTSGAKGWERAGLLDSITLGSAYSAGDWVEFDITLAVQNAMREDRAVDLVLGIVGVGSGVDRDALFYPNSASSSNRPEISFIYVPGSDALPSEPVPQSPLNGSWSVESGINPAPEQMPQLSWSFLSTGVSIGGWSIELDTSANFDSPDLLMATSWTDTGFDITNQTFDLANSLDTGETWYWRVRATSSTNQIGNWSNSFHFLLPDITTWSIDSNSAAVELHHREAMPSLNIPNFIDSWVADSGVGSTADQSSSSSMKVGTDNNGADSTGLLKIPLTELPNPQNAHISSAVLNLYAEFGSDTGNSVSIHPALVAWNTSANGTTYDGVNNWSSPGAMGTGDRGGLVDVQEGASANWMNFDVTELVQAAFANGDSHLSLMVVGSIDEGQTIFTTTEGTSSDRPWLNMTWTTGNASSPESAGTNSNPTPNQIIWDTSTHALLPGSNPSLTWTHSNPSNVDDWRLFIWNDYSDERAGWTVYDSRESSNGWDITNLTWTSPSNLASGDSYEWFVQPITNDIFGARGNDTIFHIPESTGESINSTDANIDLQEGQIVEALDYPAIFMDTYLDSGSANSAYESESQLIIGRSNYTTSQNHYTESMIMLDWSTLPIPGNHEFFDSQLTLHKISGGEINQESVRIAVCEVQDTWNQSATMNGPTGNNSNWSDPKCDIPFEIGSMDYQDNSIELDITYAVQHAHAAGLDKVNLLFAVVSDTNEEWHFASSDYTIDESKRPEVNLQWRTGTQWLPSPALSLLPADGSTIWNETASRPRGADDVTMNWSALESNETRWVIQSSTSPYFIDENETRLFDLSDNSTFNGTWDYSNLAYTTPDNVTWGDFWMYWRVRAEQDHRLGTWSDVHSFRVPGILGSDDGAGNNTIVLFDGSVFNQTSALPGVPDATIDSSISNSNLGNNGRLDLGISSGGSGESMTLLTFDLSELPFPAAMTPTNVLLSLYRYGVNGTSSQTVSVHACDTFDEGSVTWNTAPSCSSAEVTRSTLLIFPPNGWQEWDLTSLAQSNIANGNNTLSIMLKSVGTPASGHSFYDNSYSDSIKPKLTLEYVDNVDGVIPPAQPVLNNPADGAILYNTTNWVLESLDKPELTWNPVTNATGYVVTIASSDGQLKYKSWEDSEINGTTFTFSQDLVEGSVYSWWVQAINGSIPGPSSSRRSFAIGSPVDNTYNDDHTWTYNFQTGNEVADLGHTNIRDSYIGSGFANQNHGSESMMVGTDCEGANTECRMIFALDNDQVPLPPGAKIHSAAIKLTAESTLVGNLTLNVHRLLTNSWTQSGSTWNNSVGGTPWSSAGMTAGVEYESSPIYSKTINPSMTEVWLELGHSGMMIDGDHAWIIIGTSAAGNPGWIEFYSGESSLNYRPTILINYTDVHSVSVSPTGATTDADTPVQFSHILNDAVGAAVAEDVIWSTTDGTINATGMFTPEHVGTHSIITCFGVICATEQITVTPGLPVTLVVEDVEETITADDTFTVIAMIHDQHGNIVPGQTITYTPSNGTMSGTTFYPYSSGNQVVSVDWNGQSISVNIEVLGGVPTHYVTTGCESVVKAGETCQLNWTLHDQFGNMLDLAVGGGITWTAGGGVFTEDNGTYYGTTVGDYNITMLSTGGISHEISITVDHGEMMSLEIIASETFVTADDTVWLNTTRIDILGNRLSVELPLANWTVSDGLMVEGLPAEWHAQRRGSKTIIGSYAGMESSVVIQVVEGAITGLVLVIDSDDSTNSLQEITADDELTIKVKAHDSDGNRWTENVAWTIEHNQFSDQSVLQEMTYGSTTMFVPVFSSDSTYTLRATYTDSNITLEVTLDIAVEHGDLVNVALELPNSLTQNIDADNSLQFLPKLTDNDGNIIDSSIVSYSLKDLTTRNVTNITDIIVGNGGVWEASTVGDWEITAWAISESGWNISETVSVTVQHGDAVSVAIDVIANTAKAGDQYDLTITGTDSDGNTFLESVLWTQNNKAVPTSTIAGSSGEYTWNATTAGNHTFKFRSPGGAESEWTVTVSAHQTVSRVELTIADETVQQLETFVIEVHTFDAWENEIPVPPETQVVLTGRMTAEAGENGFWTITTLDDEKQTVTIKVHNVEVSDTIVVEGNFMGFFEAGGTLYYAGGILAILVVIVLLVVIIMVFRSGDSEYDDDDDDDDDYYEEEKSEQSPAAMGPGPSGPPQVNTGKEDWMSDYRVEDDGTEWAEDDQATWWFREPGTSEWQEWAD